MGNRKEFENQWNILDKKIIIKLVKQNQKQMNMIKIQEN